VVAKTGRAEVLKALGRLSEALAAYDAVSAEHPEDVVAKTGRAEVLKALGRLSEALAAYDAVSAEHPENVVARRGRAEVLKAFGKLDDALAAYDAVIAEHPEDVVARRGRAEVLKALGKLDDALAAYDAVIAEHPEDLIARNGRSSVLIALHRYDEAIAALPDKDINSIEDWIGYHIRGMAFLRMGRVDEALKVFEVGVIGDPIPSSREYFCAGLGLAWLRKQNYSKASEELEKVKCPALQSQTDMLRVHCYGEEEEFDLAQEAYQRLDANPQFQSSDLKDELYRRYILRVGARHDDEWIFEKETDCFFQVATQHLLSASY
jgi:tetratricopeptide (TPR) repeat protein